MTISDMIEAVETYCNVSVSSSSNTITPDQIIDLVNETLDKIADMTDNFTIQTFNSVQSNSWNELDTRTLSIIEVRDSEEQIHNNWKVKNTEIYFYESGSYEVLTKTMPNLVSETADTPDCHPIFYRPIIDYLRGMTKLRNDDTSQDGLRLVKSFYEQIKRAAKVIDLSRQQ